MKKDRDDNESHIISPFNIANKTEFSPLSNLHLSSSMPILSKILTSRKSHRDSKTNNAIKMRRKKGKNFSEINIEENKKKMQNFAMEDLHNMINNSKTFNDRGKITTYLLSLEPFASQTFSVLGQSQQEITRSIAFHYTSEHYIDKELIFRYGDKAEKFYIIHQGSVDILCPYTQTLLLNEVEFYGYLLRVRRYNELEILNDVILLNKNIFIFDDLNFDSWVSIAYNTLLKIKKDPTFLYTDIEKKKKKKRKSTLKEEVKIERLINERDDPYFEGEKLFETRDKKYLVLSLEKELIETIKICFPDLYKEVTFSTFDKKTYSILKKAKVRIEPNLDITHEIYINRLLPPDFSDLKNRVRKKVTIFKYVFIKKLNKGEMFGEIYNDSPTVFNQEQLSSILKKNRSPKIHQYNSFRLVTALISECNTYLGCVPRKCYLDNVKKVSEKLIYKKINFLLDNQMFFNAETQNLIRTYSICFVERDLKQGEYLITENEVVDKNNHLIKFIYSGEFESNCAKTINQIDDLITLYGYGDYIKKTFRPYICDLIGPPYYEEITKKVFNLRLNFIEANDIIGLGELNNLGRYAYSVKCASRTGKVFEVNSNIIRLLAESDINIRNNKDKIIFSKHKILSQILLKQRQMKIDCFFNLEKVKFAGKQNKKTILNKEQMQNTPADNKKMRRINKSNKDIINSAVDLGRLCQGSLPNMRDRKNALSYQYKKDLKSNKREEVEFDSVNLDLFLLETGRKNSRQNSKLKYFWYFDDKLKIKNFKKVNKKVKVHNKLNEKNSELLSHRIKEILPNMKINDKIDNKDNLIIKYEKEEVKTSNEINPLILDDFNRKYNTELYFRKLFNNSSAKNFEISFKVSKEKTRLLPSSKLNPLSTKNMNNINNMTPKENFLRFNPSLLNVRFRNWSSVNIRDKKFKKKIDF